MVDLQRLTKDSCTKQTGISVQYKVLPDNDVRDTIAQDVANQAGQYDVITISNFEVPSYAKNGRDPARRDLHPAELRRRVHHHGIATGFAAQDKLVQHLSLGAVK
jgi:Bacterial extracellular solute-binding protein